MKIYGRNVRIINVYFMTLLLILSLFTARYVAKDISERMNKSGQGEVALIFMVPLALTGDYYAQRDIVRFYALGIGGFPVDFQRAAFFADLFQAGMIFTPQDRHARWEYDISLEYLERGWGFTDLLNGIWWTRRAAENGDNRVGFRY